MKFKKTSIAGPKDNNQDAILQPFSVGGATWCGIADGVGSTALGGVAAQSSLDLVRQTVGAGDSMRDVFARIARRLGEIAGEQNGHASISTTLSLLRVVNSKAHVGHVGDTRVTHYRGQGVMTRTKDQTEVQRLVDDGVISRNQARRYPRRNVLLSAMSAGRSYDLFETSFALEKGDRLLLTSDGFHSQLLRGHTAEISSTHADFDEFWRKLEEALSEVVLEDDASCLALEIE